MLGFADLTEGELRRWKSRTEIDGVSHRVAMQEIQDVRDSNALRATGLSPEEVVREMKALRAWTGLPDESAAHLDAMRRAETADATRARAETKRAAAPRTAVRSVITQSQVNYTRWRQSPRFQPLGDREHGAWSD